MFERRAAMATLLANRPDNLVVVPGLGSCTWDAFAAGDDDRNFYLWGAMGGAAMIGLGLALAKPNARVAVITGDGEMLMGLGSLATIGVQKPNNLAIVVFDNGLYGETGMQASHTCGGVDLLDVARGCGIARVIDMTDDAGLQGIGRTAGDLRPRRCSPASASRPTIRRACCRRRTASSSRIASAARWRRSLNLHCHARADPGIHLAKTLDAGQARP